MASNQSTEERLRSALADRYTIEREIGSGGMATVYLAEDLKHHRKVAIKVLKPDLAATLGASRFLREIETAAKLNHPHILPLFDSGEADGFLFYVMPFVEGESLRARLERESRVPTKEAVQIAREIADALACAHKRGVIHRDVKPANILLEEGHAVLADFGVAQAVAEAEEARLTGTGVSLGTPAYMSPEQATGERDLDGRSDQYALGCVLYEMLAGRQPLLGESARAVMAAHITQKPDDLAEIAEDVPEGLSTSVMRCLEKEPDDRWSATEEFLQVIREYETPSGGLPSVEVRRTKAMRWPLMAAAAAVVVAAGWGYGQWRQATDLRWLTDEAIPTIEQLILDDDQFGAWSVGRDADPRVPGAPELNRVRGNYEELRDLPGGSPGIRVQIRPDGSAGEWVEIGTTPMSGVSLPRAYFEYRLELEGHQPIVGAGWGSRLAGALTFPPDDPVVAAQLEAGMVFVPLGSTDLHLPGLDHLERLELGPFLIDRHEVTNQEFKEFVDDEGYETASLWSDRLVLDGVELPFEEAMGRFTDLTGRPGPASWEAGDYPDGAHDLPVQGLSWYEAAAFARYVGKELPTIYHWARAADTWQSSRIVPSSNLGGTSGPVPVKEAGGLGPFGTLGMAGNVREWCSNLTGEDRYILGGGWMDPPYAFHDANAQSPFDRDHANGLRLVQYLDDHGLEEASQPIDRPHRDILSEEPAADEVFAAYRSVFEYDATPVSASSEGVLEAEDWTRERILFDAPSGERMSVYLYLPKSVDPPYQTVIHFPGSGAISQRDFERYGFLYQFDFLIKSGRAFAFPVFKSTFDRGDELASDYADESAFWRDHVVAWVQEFRRTVDYLETRPDIDVQRLAYFGYSWGGYMGAIIPAVEPRLQVSVLYVAGLLAQRARPEVEPLHYLPRVTLPTLMLSGRYDHFYPVETAQRPLFELLGTPESDKVWHVYEGGHNVPRTVLISETLDWLDKYLGPVEQ